MERAGFDCKWLPKFTSGKVHNTQKGSIPFPVLFMVYVTLATTVQRVSVEWQGGNCNHWDGKFQSRWNLWISRPNHVWYIAPNENYPITMSPNIFCMSLVSYWFMLLTNTQLDAFTWKYVMMSAILFRMRHRYGRRARSVSCQRWLGVVCVDVRALRRSGVSAAVLVDGLRWSHE